VVVFGWTLDRHIHISVPIICTFVLGWAANSTQSVITTFLVDVFPKQGASATAALNLARCLMGAGGTAFILPMINSIGAGWGFTILTAIMVCGLALVALQMHVGQQWRRKREEKRKKATN
jgi:sugar phosphate permease